MKDRELLQSLGEHVPDFWRDLDCQMKVEAEAFWLRMDDALVKRGLMTRLDHVQEEPELRFFYHAMNADRKISHSSFGATRNEAVRSVYEQIITAEKESKS